MDDPPSPRPSLSKILAGPILRLVSPRSGEHAAIAGRDDAGSGLTPEQESLIRNVLAFRGTAARSVMVPRPDVVAVDAASSLDEIVRHFERSNYSRLPVFRGTLDDVAGVLHSKDLLPVLLRPESFRLERLVHDPLFVPGSAPLDEVLRLMQARSSHFAVVVDEHGTVEGILTLEDLLEEIVGEINDEHDEEGEGEIRVEVDGTCLLPGALPVRDCNRRLGLALPESDDYTSLAGMLLARAGRLLAAGDAVEIEGHTFTVETVEGRRVSVVRMEKSSRG
jgi:CBS domain containing-hemolysin-like protein